ESEEYGSLLDVILEDDINNANLVTCSYEELLKNALSLKEAGAYVRVLPDLPDQVLAWRWVKRLPVEVRDDKAIAFEISDYYFVMLDFYLDGPFNTTGQPGYFKQTRSIYADRLMTEWRGEYYGLRTDSNTVFVWHSELAEWRVMKYASPYCGSVYPESIEK
ncbi:MAG TPA: hypothetical protein PK954_06370, partial [Anaerolineales bacterium]|nr:hypothetical protein [Anaerolineales bacterium]